jgi:hypothetical protein
MAIFEDQTLWWKGEAFVVPATRMLGAIAVIEEHITFIEMVAASQGKPPLVKISRAFGALLRYAGCKVSDEEVYRGLFDAESNVMERIETAVTAFLLLMTPPATLLKPQTERTALGNLPAASKPSKPSTRRRSASAAG